MNNDHDCGLGLQDLDIISSTQFSTASVFSHFSTVASLLVFMRARSSVFGLALYLLHFPIWLLGAESPINILQLYFTAIRRTLLLVYLLHGPLEQNMWQKYGRMDVVKLALTESDKGPVSMFGWARNSHVQTFTIDALTGINSVSSSVIWVYFLTET